MSTWLFVILGALIGSVSVMFAGTVRGWLLPKPKRKLPEADDRGITIFHDSLVARIPKGNEVGVHGFEPEGEGRGITILANTPRPITEEDLDMAVRGGHEVDDPDAWKRRGRQS